MNNFDNKQKIILIIICILIIMGIIYYIYGKDEDYESIEYEDNEVSTLNKESKDSEQTEKIIVHITGCVNNQGIVELDAPARLKDAIDAAGGLTEDANLLEVNLAYQLEDGMKIYIPSNSDNDIEDETEVVSKDISEKVVKNNENDNSGYSSSNTINSKVDINKANQTELETLPGIGPSTALKIIQYRTENGKFSSIEDVKNVNGIGDSKYENIKDLICVK